MQNFTQEIRRKCEIFSPFLRHSIQISSTLFSIKQGKVSDFIREIQHTSELIVQNQGASEVYLTFYTKRLIQQFDLLKKAVDKIAKPRSQSLNFVSGYQFAKNLEKLPASQRLAEYQKILRALNEKISWLSEQCYACQDDEQKKRLLSTIQETEYRKQKCLVAIKELA